MDKLREKFEAWMSTQDTHGYYDGMLDSYHRETDSYGSNTAQSCYVVWKAAKAQSEWVGVEDRLPENGDLVVARLESRSGNIEYRECEYNGYFPFLEIDWSAPVGKKQRNPVTHWSLLPKGPSE